MNATTKQYGGVKKVAKIYDCHPATVWRMVQRGQLSAPIKIGNLTRWDLSELGVASDKQEAA